MKIWMRKAEHITKYFGRLLNLKLLSDKSINSDAIDLSKSWDLINIEFKTAEELHNFFSNVVKNLKILEYKNFNPNFENVEDPVFKATLKYKSHPSIIAVK